ncbi:AMP-binding protein [Maritimibacter sp. UBA3975]|uniref:class I adenylate-forming enzyme family protein n=1 Tax=Maritimibacter sp. UBA3975 TaxID=1946833 RepID=UPI000C0AA588|nr:AMP-binding protein [Maritimibacter sp. UBA3975]MAM63936.1 long-chain fatty acid--CoA ligase [Maritimibacter sp.]|tara:strand:+ start:2138 stop:3646 length:1509 start_codon:yes stop_codon:yes gene_type:complete
MDRIHELTRGHPAGDLAVIDHDGARYSFGDLDGMVRDLVATLYQAGLRAGDRLMIVSENSASFAVAVLAASRIGAWVMPVNARMSHDELDALKDHAGARFAIFTGEASAPAREHADRLGATSRGRLACGDILLAGPLDTPGCEPEPQDATREGVAALIYTTGTTSAPKGVMLTHGNLIWNAEVSARLRHMAPGDDVVGVLPCTHIFGFASVLLASLAGGSAIRFLPRFSPEAVLDAFAAGGSVMPAVPQMYQAILAELARRGTPPDAPRLRYISSGGAPLDPEWKEKIEATFGIPLQNGYGLTETSPGVSGTRLDNPRNDTSVGQILDEVECLIDEPDDQGVGELLIRGPNIMKGYYRNPEATAQAIRPDGYFRSGDFAKIDPDETLWIMGRKKELIIRSGFNVYPPEVEAMLTRHPDVLQTAVVGRQVPGNEEILAFVTTRPGVTEADLKTFLHERLVSYKIPQHIFIIDRFPAAATGKILKHKLTETFAEQLTERDAAVS